MPELNRRQAFAGLGTVSLGALLAACDEDEPSRPSAQSSTERTERAGFDDTSACTLTPEQTEGPYYFDVDSIRSDIREDREGVPLELAIRIRDERCEPIRNAVVDVWHCDAAGSYSGFEEEGTFLRGAQVTDADGIVEFTTIYPGWYPGRTVHIHAKVHLDKQTVLTTQLYFDERTTAAVYRRPPYASDTGDTTNRTDGIFDERLVLRLTEAGDGYRGAISFDVEST
jgi:protocatechuate 3,4-dioxygenase beta subunit